MVGECLVPSHDDLDPVHVEDSMIGLHDWYREFLMSWPQITARKIDYSTHLIRKEGTMKVHIRVLHMWVGRSP